MTLRSQKDVCHSNCGATDLVPLLSVIGLVFLYGLIISLYSMAVHFSTFQTSGKDSVKQVALEIARNLSAIYIDDPMFGRVGIVDHEPTKTMPVRISSLNRLYATNRLDSIAAKRLGLPIVWLEAETDLRRLQDIERQLRIKLLSEIDSTAKPKGTGAVDNWYTRAYRNLSKLYGIDETMIDLHIGLGTLTNSAFSSGQPGFTTASDGDILRAGQYRTNLAISSSDNGNFYFYPVADKPQLCEESLFAAGSPHLLPSAVLIKASFKSSLPAKKVDVVNIRSACAIAGGAKFTDIPSVFMISFPHGGICDLFNLRQLMTQPKNQGFFLQASNGNVPGEGHLIRPVNGPREAPTNEAVQIAFYHWLRSLGPNLKIDKIASILDKDWSTAVTGNAERHTKPAAVYADNEINSAITSETNARQFALIHQSRPAAAGQSALHNAFEGTAKRNGIPASALPLHVNVSGNCALPETKELNIDLINEFLTGLYETNIAAIESQITANAIIERLELASKQIETHSIMLSEELNSVKLKFEKEKRWRGAEHTRSLLPSERSLIALDATLSAQNFKIKHYHDVIERARAAIANTQRATRDTYYVATHLDWLARGGIRKNTEHSSSFLLSDQTLFTPVRRALTEEELFRPELPLWTSKQLTVVEQLPAEPKALELLSRATQQSQTLGCLKTQRQLRFILIDSRLLTGRPGKVLALEQSPFADSGVPSGQLLFYCQDAIRTGKTPQIAWSALIRDVVANWQAGGMPVQSKLQKWFSNDELQTRAAPGLAVEVQMRAPTPVLDKLFRGDSLLNPETRERTPQIPPTPAEML